MTTTFHWSESQSINLHPSLRITYWLGGLTCMILIIYSLATMYIMFILGPPPDTIEGYFIMLNENKFYGLLRLDLLTSFIMPLYFILFYSLYVALKKTNQELVTISTLLVFIGITMVLSAPAVFSYLHLSEKYALATDDMEKNQLIAAGEAILAADTWHGTGSAVGAILSETGIVLISIIMLKNNIFNKLTAYTGIVTHGLDLIHIFVGFFSYSIGSYIMIVAGPLYLLWFPLLGVRLFRLSRFCIKN